MFSSESPTGNLLPSSWGSWPGFNGPRAPAFSGYHLETASTVPRVLLAPCHVDSPTWPLTAPCSREESLVLSARKVETLRASELTPSRHPLVWRRGSVRHILFKNPFTGLDYLSFSQRLCNHNFRFLSRSPCLNLSSYCPLEKFRVFKSHPVLLPSCLTVLLSVNPSPLTPYDKHPEETRECLQFSAWDCP